MLQLCTKNSSAHVAKESLRQTVLENQMTLSPPVHYVPHPPSKLRVIGLNKKLNQRLSFGITTKPTQKNGDYFIMHPLGYFALAQAALSGTPSLKEMVSAL